MPRPRKPDAPSSTERSRVRRITKQTRTVELPGEAMAALAAIRERDGDTSNAAAVARLIRKAL